MSGNLTIRQGQQAAFMDLMQKLQPKMAAVLPRHLTPERMIKVVLAAAMKVPALYGCTKESVIKSVMDAAQLGLDCGGALGSAYLIPYGTTCTLIVGYRGMIDLARRSGQIESIESRAVFAGDEFDLEYGLNSRLTHRPKWDQAPEPEKMLGCYVIAHFRGGGHHVEWMSRQEIDGVRRRSKASGNGPWATDYVEMAKKTVVRRAFKWLPMSTELAATLTEISADSETVGGASIGDIIDSEAAEITDSGGGSESPPTTDQQVLSNLQNTEAVNNARAAGSRRGKKIVGDVPVNPANVDILQATADVDASIPTYIDRARAVGVVISDDDIDSAMGKGGAD